MGATSHCSDDIVELEWVFCGEKKKGSLESRSLMYFLDGLEGKE